MLKERLDLMLRELGLSGRAFEKECGLTNGSYSSLSDGVGADKLNKILFKYPQFSAQWLITGKGSMLLSNGEGELSSTENITISREVFDVLKQQLDEMKAWRKQNERLVDMLQKNIEKGGGADENYPVVTQAAAGG